MYIALGYNCNHQCIICPCSGDVKKDMQIGHEELCVYLRSVSVDNNIRHITISGGEPTLYYHLHDILSSIVDLGLKVTILSNSERFEDIDFVKDVFYGLDRASLSVTTSIHSHKEELHDNITQVRGSFLRTMKGLKNLLSESINVTAKHCITRLNCYNIENFVNFIFDEFPINVRLLFCNIDYCGKAAFNADVLSIPFVESGACLEKGLDRVLEFYALGKKRVTVVTETPLCSVDPYYWHFFSNSSRRKLLAHISPRCTNEPMLINTNLISECGLFSSQCEECDVKTNCPGGWRTAFDVLGDSSVRAVKSVGN